MLGNEKEKIDLRRTRAVGDGETLGGAISRGRGRGERDRMRTFIVKE